ncbi:phosphoglycolate phosphatase [Falsiroseomonas sp. CW058]|uniref:phosphoglycolate phosphatase n=1 Tax=Falsiroseomonas sp. CW058 TaxID=3388664 RepID=UPI003D320BED
MPPLAVFDLDGTLLDSAPDIAAALNRALAAAGIAPFALPEVTAMIGDGAKALIEKALAARGLPFDPALHAAFLADEDIHAARLTRPYDGIEAVLGALAAAGWRLAVCTNKPATPARSLLDSLGLGRHFAALGGGDSFATRKPDPAHLLGTVALAGGNPDRAVMIGDHRNDVNAARGAGIPCIFAGWGYGPREMAADSPVAAAPAALPALLDGLRQRG